MTEEAYRMAIYDFAIVLSIPRLNMCNAIRAINPSPTRGEGGLSPSPLMGGVGERVEVSPYLIAGSIETPFAQNPPSLG